MPGNWVFRSLRLKGRQPRVANMLVEDYPLPAAAKAGILSSHRNDENRLVDDEPRRFGFHNLRRSLASFLVRGQTDPKTVPTDDQSSRHVVIATRGLNGLMDRKHRLKRHSREA